MILVLNLKMNLSITNIVYYERAIHNKKVIILPQYPYIPFFRSGSYTLGSQDVSKYAKGSYTGEVCAKGLKQLGVQYVLVGHSERKEYFKETIFDFKDKIQNTIDNEMIPIYCVSQSIEEYQTDIDLKGIEVQLEAIPDYVKFIIVAYEPNWMIGSDNKIDLEHVKKVLIRIKSYLMERNINHLIIYGGGVTPENIADLKSLDCNDGFIISSSALDLNNLEKIYHQIAI